MSKPYVVRSDWCFERCERFTHFFPALLTYIARSRGRFGADLTNQDHYDVATEGVCSGLTEAERVEIEEIPWPRS